VRDSNLAEALGRVGLLDELKDCLDTLVGEDGSGLSGGQRQRLVLARVLLRPAGVIVLDEATSALDNINEEHFMAALETSGRTVIAIAHRLSMLRKADQIVVMDAGRIVQAGAYDALDAQPGLFHELLHAGDEERSAEEAYQAADEEWHESGEAQVWDLVTGDGIDA